MLGVHVSTELHLIYIYTWYNMAYDRYMIDIWQIFEWNMIYIYIYIHCIHITGICDNLISHIYLTCMSYISYISYISHISYISYISSIYYLSWCIYNIGIHITYIYIFMYVSTYKCMKHIYIYTSIHLYTHTSIHLYSIHTLYIYTYIHTYIHTDIQTYRHTDIHTEDIHTYIHTDIQTYIHTWSHDWTTENLTEANSITWQTAIKQKQKKVNGPCQTSTPQALTQKHSVLSLPQTYWESTKSDSIACQTATKAAKDTWWKKKKTMSLEGGTPYFLKGHSLFLEGAVLIFETTVLSLQKQWALTEPLTIQPTPTP